LIHVSELSEHRIAHPKEVVKEGDQVTLRVIKIDPERRRIGLSLRKVDSAAYSDLDWKMVMAEEVEGAQEAIESTESMAEIEQPVPEDAPVAEVDAEVEGIEESEKAEVTEEAEEVVADEQDEEDAEEPVPDEPEVTAD
jgi:small subunit ribosomal protein S1